MKRMSGKHFILAIGLASVGLVSGQKAVAFPPSSAFTSTAATKPVEIVDPVLQMKAYSFVIPANWIFEGAVMQGSPCSSGASPIFRMMSPDGITEYKMLPRFDWTWTNQPKNAAKPAAKSGDCLPFDKEMSASDFAKYMVGVLGVTFVREETAPWLAQLKANEKQQNAQAAANAMPGNPVYSSKSDGTRFVVRYNVNSIAVEERLDVTTLCSDSPFRLGANVSHFYTCNAWVSRARARQGQLDATDTTFKAISKSTAIDQQWNQKWMAIMLKKIDEMGAQSRAVIGKMADDNARIMQARHTAFMQGQEMRQRQHEQFMATMQRGHDMFMNRQQEAQNARAKAADDWCDFALDLRKRYDPNTGEISKDSSRYTYTWVNEFGKRYQTDNVNENPNGNGTGNWTLQENVR
jgi:hypothetical protein